MNNHSVPYNCKCDYKLIEIIMIIVITMGPGIPALHFYWSKEPLTYITLMVLWRIIHMAEVAPQFGGSSVG